MIKDLIKLANSAKAKISSVATFDEITFDEIDKEKIQALDDVIGSIYDHSFEMKLGPSNRCFVPSQYILYAIAVKPFALNLRTFVDKFSFLGNTIGNDVLYRKLSQSEDIQYGCLQMTNWSEKNFDCFLRELCSDRSSYGKKIYDDNKLRKSKEVFTSCILKQINVPNASSESLGNLIYYLSGNEDTYAYFEKKYLKKIGCPIIKESEANHFVYQTLNFLYQYDQLAKADLSIIIPATTGIFDIPVLMNGHRTEALLFGVNNQDYDAAKNSLTIENYRFFDEPIFEKSSAYIFCSNQWRTGTDHTMDLSNFQNWINSKYNEFNVRYLDEHWILESVTRNTLEDVLAKKNIPLSFETLQKILFGAPGTGKSYKIDAPDSENGFGLKSISQKQKFHTTFHPDYDYAQFVGSYKPKKAGDLITYDFVPQVFAKAYVAAWLNYLKPSEEGNIKPVYLVIEEINRGNCAQIFGDIFQLLDRRDGHSEYPIDVDSDFAAYIRRELGDDFAAYKALICSYCENVVAAADIEDDKFCKIALPSNFNILATMNTSDQSLFPMDSAFKRRYDWKYVPIDYNQNKADFTIKIGEKKYKWLDFLQAVNKDIKSATQSEDKQMGEFFVKPKDNIIDLEMFKSKILFYLWDSVYKEETGHTKIFHYAKNSDPEDKVSFQTYFEGTENEQIALVQKIFDTEHLNVSQIDEIPTTHIEGTIEPPIVETVDEPADGSAEIVTDAAPATETTVGEEHPEA